MNKRIAFALILSLSNFAPPFALSQTTDNAKTADKPSETAVEKSADNWQQSLKECEQQLAMKDTARAVNLYIAAIQGAEAAKISCNDDAFVDLMAVANALTCSEGAVGPNALAETSKAIENALQWQMHAALAICGKDSPAEFHAYITQAGWQMRIDKDAARQTLEKANAIAPKLESRKPELAKIQKAAQEKVLAGLQSSLKTIRSALTETEETSKKK